MKERFHINKEGAVGLCEAELRDCPYSNDKHFDSFAEAQKEVDRRMIEKYGLMGIKTRNRDKEKDMRVGFNHNPSKKGK